MISEQKIAKLLEMADEIKAKLAAQQLLEMADKISKSEKFDTETQGYSTNTYNQRNRKSSNVKEMEEDNAILQEAFKAMQTRPKYSNQQSISSTAVELEKLRMEKKKKYGGNNNNNKKKNQSITNNTKDYKQPPPTYVRERLLRVTSDFTAPTFSSEVKRIDVKEAFFKQQRRNVRLAHEEPLPFCNIHAMARMGVLY